MKFYGCEIFPYQRDFIDSCIKAESEGRELRLPRGRRMGETYVRRLVKEHNLLNSPTTGKHL